MGMQWEGEGFIQAMKRRALVGIVSDALLRIFKFKQSLTLRLKLEINQEQGWRELCVHS